MNLKDMYIKVEGEGTPLILMHGWGSDHQSMQPIYDHFKKTNRVCMFDLCGFGKSVPLLKGYSLYDYVSVLEEIVRVYNLKNPYIIAHSFGARIAFLYASLYPVRFLILCGAAGIKGKRDLLYYIKVYTYKVCTLLKIDTNMGSEDFKKADLFLRNTLVMAVNMNMEDAIRKVMCPILLVCGSEDVQTPLWMQKRIQTLNKNATLIVFENEDHFAYLKQIHRFLTICTHVLKEENDADSTD